MWDSKRKIMGYTDMFSIRAHGWPFSFEADSPIMQFTGLCDKNKAPIFEGDVVDIGCTFDLVTMDRFPTYWLEHEEFGYKGEDLVNPIDCVIVGNIYQSPDLMDWR